MKVSKTVLNSIFKSSADTFKKRKSFFFYQSSIEVTPIS